jgi:serine/threonine protein kinase
MEAPEKIKLKLERPNTYIKKYENLELLGTGVYGVVFLAVNRTTGNLVAVKRVDLIEVSERTGNTVEYLLRMIRNETSFLIELSREDNCHPHIVCYYETIVDLPNDYVYIVMENIKGKDLKEYVKFVREQKVKDTVLFGLLLVLLKQLLQALAYIHSFNIVHSDIKPPNILVRDIDNSAVLIDFGLACRYLPDDTSCSSAAGSPAYAAPEVSAEHRRYPVSDIWSLGISFYDAIHGDVWTETDNLTNEEFFEYIQDPNNRPYFQTSNMRLNQICNNMLEVDYHKRPDASALLAMFPSSVAKLPSINTSRQSLSPSPEPRQVTKGFGSPN